MPQNRKQNTPGHKPTPRKRNTRVSKGSVASVRSFSRKKSSTSTAPRGFSTSRSRASASHATPTPLHQTPRSATTTTGQKNFKPEVVLTRRNLLIGAAGIGGVALLGGIGTAVLNAYEGSNGNDVAYLNVPTSAVTDLESYTQVKTSDAVSLEGSYQLAYNTLVWADNDSLACCLVPGSTSSPLNTVEVLSLSQGSTYKLLSEAQGASESFEIFDARCSERGLIWTECNVLENRWRIYIAPLSGTTLGSPTLVDEGDSTWLTPSIAAVNETAFWQVCPQADVKDVPETAGLKAARFSDGAASTIYASDKAFATRVTPASDGVVITPRVNTTGVYYQLTKIDETTFETSDSLVLPSSMKPYEAAWGSTGFAFAFENIYNYGDGIANLGTYAPLKQPDAYSYNNINWFHFTRTPSSAPSWCDPWFVVKSTRAMCGINMNENTYFMIDAPSGTDNYGEYLISSGTSNYMVGLSQITDVDDAKNNHALVRVYAPK